MARPKSKNRSARALYLEERAKERGYESVTALRTAQVQAKGFKSLADYQKYLLAKRGKTPYQYATELIERKMSKEECKVLENVNKKMPELLDDKSKKIINNICKRYLLSDII